jgi:hypothetical protein
MRGCLSFLLSIIVIALIICVLGWVFSTDFFIFDILLLLGWFALKVVFWIVIVIIILWVLNEIFR